MAAVRRFKELDNALSSDVKTVFLLWGELVGIKHICTTIKAAKKITDAIGKYNQLYKK